MIGRVMEERIPAGLLALIVVMAIIGLLAMVCGCNGNTVSVKPDSELKTDLQTSLKNQQQMSEKIETMSGSLTKIQTDISTVINSVTNILQQEFETFTNAQRQEFKSFTGTMKNINESNTNTTAYGIGLVATVLLFALALIWIMAKTFRSAAVKFL